MESQLVAKTDNFQIFDQLQKYMRHWRWFLISALLCCGIAFLYMKTQPNVYSRSAAVLIKEDNTSELTAAFSEKNPFKAGANVNNEIEAFKSPYLMQEVVKRLNLNISYTIREGLRNIELYSQSPIKASITDMQDQESFSFYAELLPDSMIILSKFEQNGVKFNPTMKAKLNTVACTPIGNIEISPTLFYSYNMYDVPIKICQISVKNATIQFAGSLAVSLASKENTIINLVYTDVSVQRADDVLNTIISVYNEKWMDEKNKVAKSTSRFINDRLPLIETELGGIDDNLVQYKSENLLTDMRSAASLFMKESSDYSGKTSDALDQLKIAHNVKKYLGTSSKLSDLLPTNTGLSSVAIESSLTEYNTLLLKRNRLLANSSEKNPVVKELNNELNGMRQSIIRTIDNLIVALNIQISSLQAQQQRMTDKIADNPGQEKHVISIERDQKVKESLYIYLMQKREENELSLAITTTNTRIINPPSGSDAPIGPKKKILMLGAFVLGLAIPFSVIWGRDTLDTTIQGKKDMKRLSAPLLGVIPQATHRTQKTGVPLVQERCRDIVNESFRILRTNMDFLYPKDMKVIMFTSFDSGVGKTFMTLNMAMSFALIGKKVVAVDLDMRKATLSSYILSRKAGITDYLCGTVTAESVIIKDHFYPGFDIVTVGEIPPNPVELLLDDKLKSFIETLKAEYDYIFIDGAPVNLVTDATIVSKYSDLNVFVVREGYSDYRIIPELENIYCSGKFKNMTILLNGSVQDSPSEKSGYFTEQTKKFTKLGVITNPFARFF